MFEAYKVGVTLALTNQVSGVLGLIARDFMKTHAQAKALQHELNKIKLLGMGGAVLGGVGFMGLGAIKGAVKPAMEYVHQLELAKTAGMSQLEIAQATKAAWQATGTVMTTTATENIAAIKELRMVFGDTQHAIDHMATVQKLQAVLQNVRGGKAKDEAYMVAKVLEMKGDVQNPAMFETAADLMTKAINASGGKVGASDFHSAFKYGRSATIGWDHRFTYGILPTLIQEMKSAGGSGGVGGPGNALMSAYSAVVGGTVPQKALKVWDKIGMLDPSKVVWTKDGHAKGLAPGGIRGGEVFQSDPYRWTQEFLVPALVKAGYDTEEKQRQALQYLFPNRTAGFVMSQMALQPWKFDRDERLIAGASGLSSYNEMIKHDPKMAMKALHAQWENLKTAIGVTVVPVILPVLHGLATAFNTLGRFLQENPTLTTALTLTFTGLSGLATLGGGLMIAAAGLKVAGVALTTLTGLPLGAAATGLGLLVPAVASVVALGMAVANADAIGGSKYNPLNLISDGTEAATRWIMKKTAPSYGPPMRKEEVTLHTTVNMDGRKVAHGVNRVNMRDAARPSGSGGAPDYRALPRHSGSSGGW